MAERRKNQGNLLRFVLGALAVSLLIGGTMTFVTLRSLPRVKHNTNSIRRAGYETCVRGNGVRAELQFRAGLTPPNVARQLIKQLGLPKDLATQTGTAALRRRLPIFDCKPLLHNAPARILTTAEQQRFVEDFARGEKPLPPPPP